jgi:perosamine synthetase
MIPVYEPSLGEEEVENVLHAVKSGWISSKGEYIPEFEDAFSKYIGVAHGVACANGTTALHLALTALGLKKGDEVIVPTLTFVSTANVVLFTGATPVFVDADSAYWCIDPQKIEDAISKRTKAIIPVHLYGNPCDMRAIMKIAHDHDLYVVEDAAESHGALYNGKMTGSFGDIGCFSFYGNKIITTGEGGMCVTNNEQLADAMRRLRDHGMDPDKKFWHDRLGFNYRMTNLQAAVGVAQVKKLKGLIEKKRQIAAWYGTELEDLARDDLIMRHPEPSWAKTVYWMYSILLNGRFPLSRDEVVTRLKDEGIETRPFFYPIHTFPWYNKGETFPVAEALSRAGINLPSSANLRKSDVQMIAEKIRRLI